MLDPYVLVSHGLTRLLLNHKICVDCELDIQSQFSLAERHPAFWQAVSLLPTCWQMAMEKLCSRSYDSCCYICLTCWENSYYNFRLLYTPFC